MTFNDWIKKYMNEDRNPLIPLVVDKFAVRTFAGHHGLPMPKLLKKDKATMVVKANNDSGSTLVYKYGKLVSGRKWKLEQQARGNVYGVDKGEWFYEHIPFCVIREEYLGDNITDYKFHCHKGKVMFCQVIGDRNTKTSECLYLPDGTELPYILDLNFNYKHYDLPKGWDYMLSKAAELSSYFNYVRVDFYEVDKIYLGELTFAPRGGKYTGEGQVKLGQLF